MPTNYKKLIALVLFLSAFNATFAQDGNEYCFHQETKNGTSKFLNYLHKKYGVELSEKILMNVKSYEAQYEVFVMYKTEYQLITEKIEALLSQTTDSAAIQKLQARKAKIVLFDTIEPIVNH